MMSRVGNEIHALTREEINPIARRGKLDHCRPLIGPYGAAASTTRRNVAGERNGSAIRDGGKRERERHQRRRRRHTFRSIERPRCLFRKKKLSIYMEDESVRRTAADASLPVVLRTAHFLIRRETVMSLPQEKTKPR